MLKLSLAAVERGEVRLQEEIPADAPIWDGFVAPLVAPARVELVARPVGSGGVLVSGSVDAELEYACRRCLAPVRRSALVAVEMYFRPAEESGDEDDAESYLLPPGVADVSLADAVREQLLLELPEFVECSEKCRGLCPSCGADLNRGDCACEPERDPGPWDALRKVKFD